MDITIGIELANDRDQEVTVELPIGSVIQANEWGNQNVALSKAYRFTIPGNSRLITQVQGVCLNRDLNPPRNVPGSFTPFRFDADEIDQDAVWHRVARPIGA